MAGSAAPASHTATSSGSTRTSSKPSANSAASYSCEIPLASQVGSSSRIARRTFAPRRS